MSKTNDPRVIEAAIMLGERDPVGAVPVDAAADREIEVTVSAPGFVPERRIIDGRETRADQFKFVLHRR